MPIQNTELQIQLEIPNYSYEYQKYIEKQHKIKEEETVVVIDLY